MEQTSSFGAWLRLRRKALDLTQDELARQVGCAVGTIRKLEGDERRPSKQLATRLAAILQIAPNAHVAFLKASRAELAVDQLAVAARPVIATGSVVPDAELPTGTLTFLLADIESSPEEWPRHPVAMRAALDRRDLLLRQAVEQRGGIVFTMVGDALQAAFMDAANAMAAALAAQRSFQTEGRSATGSFHVRMALHTGTADVRGGTYVGHTLNRAARLLRAGHGGQILLSAATCELLRDHLPPELALTDLGAHWLTGLARPEQIYQAITPGLPSTFPPLVGLDRPNTNLSVQPTAFIGRDEEVATVSELLRHDTVRLVTLTGPGGSGKTRLAIHIGTLLLEAFSDGVWFVNLAPLGDPGLVAASVAQVFGLREAGEQPIQDVLQSYLRAKRLLLLLDNFEHLAAAAPLVNELLAAAPDLTILVTSRAPLHLSGEREYAVPPLALPRQLETLDVEQLMCYEAVRLFGERAQAVKADFAITAANARVVAQICIRLDGLPLAIELAAARIKLFPPQALLARLDDRLELLTGGARDLPGRQQTIRNTLDWSYQLLGQTEQTLFARLGVFVGGCTLAAAEAICTTDDDLPIAIVDSIAALLDHSLLRQEEGPAGEPRLTMLETIHAYALGYLGHRGEAEVCRQRHAAYFTALAEAAELGIQEADQLLWLERLDADHDNLRAALAWSLATSGMSDVGLRLAAALWRFWSIRGFFREGRQWLAAALSTNPAATTTRARALLGAGTLAGFQDDHAMARACGAEALSLATTLSDTRCTAAALYLLATMTDAPDDAFRLGEQSLALSRELGNQPGMALALHIMGLAAFRQGQFGLATRLWEEGLAINRALGDKQGMGWFLALLGNLAVDQGEYEPAAARLEESRDLFLQLGQKHGLARTTRYLGHIALARGDDARAYALAQECEQSYRDVGDNEGILLAHYLLGDVARRRGEQDQAKQLFREVLTRCYELEYNYHVASALEALGLVATAQDQAHDAAQLFGAAERLRETLQMPMAPANRAEYDRAVAAARVLLGEAAFSEAWRAGQSITLERLIALASAQT